ncbi:MAG: HAMP domain-containing histidine kinase [Clostridiales bacterium]|jgi:signal transduction histidine kinase|nr:HAMP domain-containing histidine kinase [Clostridiales bacterium]
MPIKKKLIIASISIFFIPIFSSILIASAFMRGYNEKYGNENTQNQVQLLERFILGSDLLSFHQLCLILEKQNYYIQADINGTRYETPGFKSIQSKSAYELRLKNDANLFIMSSLNGFEYYSTLENGYICVVSKKPPSTFFTRVLSEPGSQYIEATMTWVILSITGIVVLVIALSVWIITRSILKPLGLIQEGTRQIKNGNLHYKIEYAKNDEFGAVCEDFEDMRLSLLRLKEEEERYEDNRKELIAGITHDLNTPLTSIKGFASGLLDGIANTPQKTRAYLENIKSTADRMGRLIAELLLYSTLDMGGVPFSFERIDMNEYFADCCRDLYDDYLEKDMVMHFKSTNENVCCNIDIVQFNRAVINVLENCAKYKCDGKGNIYISVTKAGSCALFSFRDDGLGISPVEAGNVFQVFYREDKSRGKTVGSGLGLAIVQRIITAHNGTVQVNPAYTNGLEIIMTLPLVQEGAEKHEANTDH